jgi:chromate reductase
VIIGSLQKDSINRKVANALAVVAPEGLKLSIVEIEQLRAAQANSPFAR